jgi:hypothetical protein
MESPGESPKTEYGESPRKSSKSLDELAQEQGVEPIESIDDLRGDDIDEDEFANFMRAVRGES